jgi:RNA polymerase sigma factor (sigma-70 family)
MIRKDHLLSRRPEAGSLFFHGVRSPGPPDIGCYILKRVGRDTKNSVGFRFRRVLISKEMMTDDAQLLQQYTRERSESAFGELVTRHIDLVYSVALRIVGGDRHLAQDVTQTVFADLARKAWSLPREVLLAGWLHRHTSYTAAKAVRTERRRKAREQTAMEMRALDDNTAPTWEQIAPVLDEAMNQLSASDRDAIVLRFLKRQDFRAVGSALGVGEDAAQKRVSRALEKLRTFLNRRGVTLTATTLGTTLATEAVVAAPAGLAVSVTATSLAGAAAATGISATLMKFMAMTKFKAGLAGALVIASVVMPLVVHHKAQARLRDQDAALRQHTDQLAKLRKTNQKISNQFAQPKNSQPLPNDEFSELMRLRGEVGLLRNRAQELTKIAAIREEEALLSRDQLWPARVKRLKQWLEENPSEKIPELQFVDDVNWMNSIYPHRLALETADECRVEMSSVRSTAEHIFADFQLRPALQQYAKANSGEFPTDISQLKPYFDSPIYDGILERYTILPASNLVSELRPGGDWVITQKAPVNEAHDWRTATSLTGTKQATLYATNRWVRIQ